MGRAPCCDKANVKRGPWSPEEDTALKKFIQEHGTAGSWISLPHKAGLNRCGKSCRLRWLNYLRPDIKHGGFTEEENATICSMYFTIGSRWSVIASNLPGRTDNDVKNHWNTKLKKKLFPRPTTGPNNFNSSANIHSSSSTDSNLLLNFTQPLCDSMALSSPPAHHLGYHRTQQQESTDPQLLFDQVPSLSWLASAADTNPYLMDLCSESQDSAFGSGSACDGKIGQLVDDSKSDHWDI